MMKKLLALLAFTAAFYYVPKPVADAQLIQIQGVDLKEVYFIADTVEDDNSATALESPAILLKYVGAQESGTVDINSNALELHAGPLGLETNAADGTDVNTGDVCGTTNNALDVTDTECDTPGELVDVINNSGANWRAVLLSARGAETLATAAEYIDPADAQAKLPGGLALRMENAAVDSLGYLVRPFGPTTNGTTGTGRDDIEFFLRPATVDSYAQAIRTNPFGNMQLVLTEVVGNLDSTSAWTFSIYAVRYSNDGTPSERLVYQRTDTTDATDYSKFTAASPLVLRPGETALIYLTDDALVTGRISVAGYFIDSKR
jgi:hypothetical protein